MPLEAKKRPKLRCHTGLFRMLSGNLPALDRPDDGHAEPDQECLWSNRPGQNAGEVYTVTALTSWMSCGACALFLVQLTGGDPVHALWAVPASVPVAFLALHVFSLAVAGFCGVIRLTGIFAHDDDSGLEQNLCHLALVALAVWMALDWGWGGKIFGFPWLVFASLSAAARLTLVVKDFAIHLINLPTD